MSLATALNAAIDAENAAIYGYSVAGARLDPAARAAARSDYDVHRAQLLAVSGWLAQWAAGANSDGSSNSGGESASIAPPAAVYSLPAPVTDAASAAAVLAGLEEATAARYADIVAAAAATAAPVSALQRAAALALQSAAVREARWRRGSVPFPGLAGRLPRR